jgi:hypothetical protein
MTARTYFNISVIAFFVCCGGVRLWGRAVEASCWAGGYSKNAWLAYCNSENYGVYDVEAIWHRVESEVGPAIASARVLTLSDSDLQDALSLGGASEWFAARNYSLYMLGLPTEESGFAMRLIDRFHPHPDVIIVDASPYFTGRPGMFESHLLADPERSRNEVLALKTFQSDHRKLCARIPWACGHTFAYFRARSDGHWIFPEDRSAIWFGRRSVPNDQARYPVNVLPDEGRPLYPTYLAQARALVAKLGIPPRCIVITHVPSREDMRALPHFIGDALGLSVIDPKVEGLTTFDNTHLGPDSAMRWTQAFLSDLEPVLQRCVGRTTATAANFPP